MRGRLQALIDYTGLSMGEAAAVIGIGHEALSRKIAGKARYDVRPEEIAALEALAAWQDAQVRALSGRVAALTAAHGQPPDDICMTLYRRDEDLLDRAGPPASAQRMVIARLAREPGLNVVPVMFDPAAYHVWRGARPDTHALRGEWAASAKVDTRFAAALGEKLGDKATSSIGWAVIQIDRAGRVIDAGEDAI